METKRPVLSLIWAMDENRLIGRDNALPWRLPADMQWFRAKTMGKPVLMGRKTFESIGRPLPSRQNIILSRRRDLAIEGCIVVGSLEEALAAAGDAEEVMVMGGAEIYALTLPHAERLYLTEIHDTFEGDAWFPPFDPDAWITVHREEHKVDEQNPHRYAFVIMERARP